MREALEESNLLVSVDVMKWESIPENFKKNIREKYVVLQEKMKLEGWREVKLGDVIRDQQSGGTPKKIHSKRELEYLILGSITEGRFIKLLSGKIYFKGWKKYI